MFITTTPKVIAIAATAACAAAVLTTPFSAGAMPPFPLAPACLDWRFPDAALFLDLDNGVNVGVPWLAGTNKVRVTEGAGILRSPDGGVWQGNIEPGGGTRQDSKIAFRIDWTQGVGAEHPVSVFTGQIDPTGTATGTVVNEKNVTNGWTAQGKFTCQATAPEPAPVDNRPTFCSATGETVPAGQPCPQKPTATEATSTITGDVELYDVPGGNGTYLGDVTGGRKVKVLQRQDDNWVQISGTGVPNHDTGWVWGDFVGP